MGLIFKKKVIQNRFFLQKIKWFYLALFLINSGALNASSFSIGTEKRISNSHVGITNDKNLTVQINKDTLLIFTKDMVIVSQIDKEKSKLFQANENLNKKIQAINPKSKYLVVYADVKDNMNVVNESGNNVSVAEIIHDHDNRISTNLNKTILFIIIILPFILLGYYFRKGKNTSKKNYESILESLKTSDDEELPILENKITIKSENLIHHQTKAIVINDETIKHILAKLEKFEMSHKYLKQDMSLAGLASYLDTNTKYLSEILKQHKGKKFCDYINGLRIIYIIEALYKNPIYREYKISYLAESCGFGSREVFAVVFKKETGISPSYFINNLKKDTGEEPPTNMLVIQ